MHQQQMFQRMRRPTLDIIVILMGRSSKRLRLFTVEMLQI